MPRVKKVQDDTKVVKEKKVKKPKKLKEYAVSLWDLSGERVANNRYYAENKEVLKEKVGKDLIFYLENAGYLTDDMKEKKGLKETSKGKPRKELTDDDYIRDYTLVWSVDKIIKGTYFLWVRQTEAIECIIEDIDVMIEGPNRIIGL